MSDINSAIFRDPIDNLSIAKSDSYKKYKSEIDSKSQFELVDDMNYFKDDEKNNNNNKIYVGNKINMYNLYK